MPLVSSDIKEGELDDPTPKSPHSAILHFSTSRRSCSLCQDETCCKGDGEIRYCLLIPAVGSGIISLGNSKIIAVMHKLKLLLKKRIKKE